MKSSEVLESRKQTIAGLEARRNTIVSVPQTAKSRPGNSLRKNEIENNVFAGVPQVAGNVPQGSSLSVRNGQFVVDTNYEKVSVIERESVAPFSADMFSFFYCIFFVLMLSMCCKYRYRVKSLAGCLLSLMYIKSKAKTSNEKEYSLVPEYDGDKLMQGTGFSSQRSSVKTFRDAEEKLDSPVTRKVTTKPTTPLRASGAGETVGAEIDTVEGIEAAKPKLREAARAKEAAEEQAKAKVEQQAVEQKLREAARAKEAAEEQAKAKVEQPAARAKSSATQKVGDVGGASGTQQECQVHLSQRTPRQVPVLADRKTNAVLAAMDLPLQTVHFDTDEPTVSAKPTAGTVSVGAVDASRLTVGVATAFIVPEVALPALQKAGAMPVHPGTQLCGIVIDISGAETDLIVDATCCAGPASKSLSVKFQILFAKDSCLEVAKFSQRNYGPKLVCFSGAVNGLTFCSVVIELLPEDFTLPSRQYSIYDALTNRCTCTNSVLAKC